MSERQQSPGSVGRAEIGWSTLVTALGALVAYSMAQPGNEPLEAAAMVLATLAAAQMTVVVVSLIRDAGRTRQDVERSSRLPGRDDFE